MGFTVGPQGKGRMNKARHFAAIFAASASLLLPRFADSQNHSTKPSLDGFWLTDGYGELFEFKGNDLQIYDITKLSCIPSQKASRKAEADTAGEIIFAANGDTFRIAPGPSRDTLLMHEDGSAWNILLRRTSSRPKPCDQHLADTPLTNYEVFWQTFAEQYAFFTLHNVDWPAVDKKFRPQVTPNTTPEELLAILSGMVEGVVALDVDQRILFANDRAAQLLSLPDRVAPMSDAIDPVQRADPCELCELFAVEGRNSEGEIFA